MKLWILITALILSSCAGPVAVVKPRVQLPAPLELPRIRADELGCLSDETYRRLVRRDTMLQERVKTLRDIAEAMSR